MKNHAWLKFTLCAAMCIAARATVLAQDAEDVKLNAFFKDYLEDQFRQRPTEATQLGDHRFNDRLDDISAEARAKWTASWRDTLKELPKQVDYHKLSRDGQIDFEILQNDLETRIWHMENRHPFEE